MTCAAPRDGEDCRCCVAGLPCAYVLVLSAKDSSAAYRLGKRFENNPPGRVNLKTTPTAYRAIQEAREPTEQIKCRGCGVAFAVPAYLVTFLREQRAPTPDCVACGPRLRKQDAWNNA